MQEGKFDCSSAAQAGFLCFTFGGLVRSGNSQSRHHAAERIQRAGRATRRDFQHMGVNHGGADIAVAEQLLHCADVGTGLQQVGCERVA